MQDQIPNQNLIELMTPMQSSTASQEEQTVAQRAMVDTSLLETIQSIQGFTLQSEQLVANVMSAVAAAAQRAEDDAGKLRALAREMGALARNAGNSIAEVLASVDGSLTVPTTQSSSVPMDMMRWDATSLTEQEQALYERRMTNGARVIAEKIGLPSTILLIEKCGGRRLRPYGKEFGFLTGIVGIEAATKLKAWLSGSPLSVPSCKHAQTAVIHSRIRAEFDRLTMDEKLSSARAVRHLMYCFSPPLSERGITRILSEGDDLSKPTPAKSPGASTWAGGVTVHRIR